MSSVVKVVVVMGVVIVAGLVVWGAGQTLDTREASAAPAARPAGQPVLARPVVLQAQTTLIEAVGTSRALRSVTLYPDVAGTVTDMPAGQGTRVEAGTALLVLDDEDARMALRLAEVTLAEAQRVDRQYRNTAGSGALSPSVIEEARAAVDAAMIERDRARLALADHRLTAPFAGYLGMSDIDPGARVTTDTAVFTLDDRHLLLVDFAVPENFLGQINPGQSITVRPWTAGPLDPSGSGKVVSVGSRVDPATRTFTVRAEIDNQQDRLRPGQSFRVSLQLRGNEYPVVPGTALQWGGDGAYVWVIENGEARQQFASVIERREGDVLVDAELPTGIQVVYEGVHRLSEGQAVRLADDAIEEPLVAEIEQ